MIASLAGVYVLGSATFNSLATAAIIVVAVAVVGSLTVLPALLVKFGRWVDRPRVPLLWRLNRRIGDGGISTRIIGPVVTRPVIALVAGLAVMLALAIPALTMTLAQRRTGHIAAGHPRRSRWHNNSTPSSRPKGRRPTSLSRAVIRPR